MTQNTPQVPWTDEQWNRVTQSIQEEALRARVAATFLPLVGPLPPDTDFVRRESISYPPAGAPTTPLAIDDKTTMQLATLQVKVRLRGAQMADSEMTSALSLFRRAANVLARLEDAVVFRGLALGPNGILPKGGVSGLRPIYEITSGEQSPGLWEPPPPLPPPFPAPPPQWILVASRQGRHLVDAVSTAIGTLEENGHYGPFAIVLGQAMFVSAQTPERGSLVLPQDRIIPLLGGGPLLRSSTLDDYSGRSGVIVPLGSTPIELVVATDVSVQFLQLTPHPEYLFRVFEKIGLRIKEADAIMRLYLQ